MHRLGHGALFALALAGCGSPTAAPLTVSPEAPTTADDLRAELAQAPSEGVTYRWAWKVDGEPVEGAWSELIGAGQTARGQTWQVTATPVREGIEGDPVTAEVTVANSPPVLAVQLMPKEPRVGEALVAVATARDADDDPLDLSWVWRRDGESVSGLAEATVPGDYPKRGEQWQVEVVASDGDADSEPATAEVTIGNSPPVVSQVQITPESPVTTTAVQVVAEGSDPDGDSLTFRYTWSVDGSVLSGQTGSTLGPTHFSRDEVVQVGVIADDGELQSSPVYATLAIRNTAPTVRSVDLGPAISRAGTTMTCTPGGLADIDGDAVSPIYDWRVNSTYLGLDAPTFGPGRVRRGDQVTCQVTPTDGTSRGEPRESRTITILNTVPTVPEVILSPEDPTDNNDLLCDVVAPSTDADGDGVEYGFRWFRNGIEYTGATSTTHFAGDTVLSDSLLVDDEWACEARASDDLGTSEWSERTATSTIELGQITYMIYGRDVIEGASACGSGEGPWYNCSGQIGFIWFDTLDRAPVEVEVEANRMVSCPSPGDRTAFLNEVEIGTFPSADETYCSCSPDRSWVKMVTYESGEEYEVGGENVFTVSVTGCEGFGQNAAWGNAIARVTVRY